MENDNMKLEQLDTHAGSGRHRILAQIDFEDARGKVDLEFDGELGVEILPRSASADDVLVFCVTSCTRIDETRRECRGGAFAVAMSEPERVEFARWLRAKGYRCHDYTGDRD